MCNHEVTNAEYRQFVHWVRDSLALTLIYNEIDNDLLALSLLNCSKKERKTLNHADREGNLKRFGLNYALCSGKNTIYEREDFIQLLQEKGFYFPVAERFYKRRELNVTNLNYNSATSSPTPVYPDTLCWLRDHPVSFMDPFTNMYFWHPAYDRFPVVGLSLQQMQAYCDWLQRRQPMGTTVTLPTRYQYEMAVKTCVIPEQRHLITVDPNQLSAFARSAEKMIFFIQRGGVNPAHFVKPGYNNFLYNWYSTYQTSPVFDLAGSVSEVIIDAVPDSLASKHMYTIGGNWSLLVVSKHEEAYNTTFYQQTVPLSGNSTTGFRIVIIPAEAVSAKK
jgi:hypothetical protein